jgi:hypothetical protein
MAVQNSPLERGRQTLFHSLRYNTWVFKMYVELKRASGRGKGKGRKRGREV